MRIRLTELKRIIRSEVRRSLHENGAVPEEPKLTPEVIANMKGALDELTEQQLLDILAAAGSSEDPKVKVAVRRPDVKDAVDAAVADAGVTRAIQVSHRHRRGTRLYELEQQPTKKEDPVESTGSDPVNALLKWLEFGSYGTAAAAGAMMIPLGAVSAPLLAAGLGAIAVAYVAKRLRLMSES